MQEDDSHLIDSNNFAYYKVCSTLALLFRNASECKGSTHISEDSSEIAFLLVENYQLTTSVGLRVGREYLEHIILSSVHLALSSALDAGEGVVAA